MLIFKFILFKFILIVLLIATYLFYRKQIHGKRLLIRLFASTILGLAILAVAFPDATTKVAGFFNIGRGVDLILYMMILFLLFAIVVLHAYLAQVKRSVTLLAREIAFMQARPAGRVKAGEEETLGKE